VTLAFGVARAAPDSGGAALMPVLGGLVVVIVAGKLGGAAFAGLRQSPVLGELLAGVVVGNLGLIGFHGFDRLSTLPGLELLAQIGVLFLLFAVGLETNVVQMAAVGGSSLAVAVVGVAAPMVLGYFTSRAFFPHHLEPTHWFVGATLCATSVGITARVLGELRRVASIEGRIILGAAVIDDVLGLIVLAVVTGVIQAASAGRAFDGVAVAVIAAKALVFLVGAIVAGRWLSRRAFVLAARLPGESMLLPMALAFCFGLAYLAGIAGLAPIVGAFAAGLILDEVHYRDLRQRDERRRDMHELLEPIAAFLVPVFFVLMGMRVDLESFAHPGVPAFALVLTLAAILGKQVCGLAVLERGVDRVAVGLGMIPRGEVGLIFASIGSTLHLRGQRVVDDAIFSAMVAMVAATTLLTPPLLMWRLGRRPEGEEPGA